MRLKVTELFRIACGGGEAHLVTRDTGRKVRREAARRLEAMEDGGVMTLDFSGVGVIDFSCADEFVAKLVTRLIAGEYGDKFLRLTRLNASQRENVEVALERKRLPTMLIDADRTWHCLGSIKPYLRETLDLVMAREKTSARDLSALLNIELNTSSTRLINLHHQRLVTRKERLISEGGREYLYAGLHAGTPAGGGTDV